MIEKNQGSKDLLLADGIIYCYIDGSRENYFLENQFYPTECEFLQKHCDKIFIDQCVFISLFNPQNLVRIVTLLI